VTGEWRKFHNKELHNLYSYPNTDMMIRIKGLRGAGSGSIHAKDEKYKVWSGNLNGEDNFQDVVAEWKIILKCILKKESIST
jgi:hypothetical protein